MNGESNKQHCSPGRLLSRLERKRRLDQFGVVGHGINNRCLNSCRAVKQRGASAVEMAIILPVLLLMIFGVIEFGRAIMVHQVLVNASREATRRAVVPGATDAQVLARISSYMSSAGISGYTVALEIDGTSATLNGSSSSITSAPSKSAIAIQISVPHSQVSWGIASLIPGNRTFAAGVQMRKE